MGSEFDRTSGFFTAFRQELAFPYFHREESEYLFKEFGLWGMTLIYTIIVLVLTVVIAFLGTRGYSRWRVSLQMTISLTIGIVILVCLTGVTWQEAEYATTKDGQDIHYGISVGLLQANISMKRYKAMKISPSEMAEYHNVKLGWYEIYQAEAEYREALFAGWPSTLLRFARYLSTDMGEMTFMRDFRWSGYSAYVLLWAAFAVWFYSNILFSYNISMGALMFLCTGILQLLAAIVYASLQPNDFKIPLSDDLDGRKDLKLQYGWMFWLITFIGAFVVIISLLILALDYLRPEDMNKFFGTEAQISAPGSSNPPDGYKNKDLKGLMRTFSQTQPTDLRRLSDTESDVSFALNDQRGTAGTPYRSYLDLPSQTASRRTSYGSADVMELDQMSPTNRRLPTMNGEANLANQTRERDSAKATSPQSETGRGGKGYDNPVFEPEIDNKPPISPPQSPSADPADQILPAEAEKGATAIGKVNDEATTPTEEIKSPPQIEVHAIDEQYVEINLNADSTDQPITMRP